MNLLNFNYNICLMSNMSNSFTCSNNTGCSYFHNRSYLSSVKKKNISGISFDLLAIYGKTAHALIIFFVLSNQSISDVSNHDFFAAAWNNSGEVIANQVRRVRSHEILLRPGAVFPMILPCIIFFTRDYRY